MSGRANKNLHKKLDSLEIALDSAEKALFKKTETVDGGNEIVVELRGKKKKLEDTDLESKRKRIKTQNSNVSGPCHGVEEISSDLDLKEKYLERKEKDMELKETKLNISTDVEEEDSDNDVEMIQIASNSSSFPFHQ